MRAKSFFKTCFSACCVLIAAILVGTLLLTLVYSLPVARIERSVAASASVFEQEGTYPRLSAQVGSLDNFTDCSMLLAAAYDGTGSPLTEAMMAKRNRINDASPTESLVRHYLNSESFSYTQSYARYWHGYLVTLKPLLLLFDYSAIRLINLCALLLLNGLLVFLIFKKRLGRFLIPYLIAVLFLRPTAVWRSLQFSTCAYILVSAGILLCLFYEKLDPHRSCLFFLGIGISTAFIDFLTYPIATFCIPAALFFCLHPSEKWHHGLLRLLKLFCFWAFGFGGMWSSKWILSSLITGENTILNALSAVVGWSGGNESAQPVGAMAAILKNSQTFFNTPITILFLLVLAAAVILLVWRSQEKTPQQISSALVPVLPILIIAVFPVLWYAFVTNHSSVHYWFTNKALSATVFSLLSVPVQMLYLLSSPTAHTLKNEEASDSVDA